MAKFHEVTHLTRAMRNTCNIVETDEILRKPPDIEFHERYCKRTVIDSAGNLLMIQM
jgi:hypothetical protein